jgi:hypothetical protein
VYGALDVEYEVVVEVEDRAGNVTVHALAAPLRTGPFADPASVRDEIVVTDLHWTDFADQRAPDVVRGRAEVRVAYKAGGPPPVPARHVLVAARIVVDGAVHADFTPGAGAYRADRLVAFDGAANELALALDGPFLLSRPTDALGGTSLACAAANVPEGARLDVVLEAALFVDPARLDDVLASLGAATACAAGAGSVNADCDGDGTADCCAAYVPTLFAPRAFADWNFPTTRPGARSVSERVDRTRPTPVPAPSRK